MLGCSPFACLSPPSLPLYFMFVLIRINHTYQHNSCNTKTKYYTWKCQEKTVHKKAKASSDTINTLIKHICHITLKENYFCCIYVFYAGRKWLEEFGNVTVSLKWKLCEVLSSQRLHCSQFGEGFWSRIYSERVCYSDRGQKGKFLTIWNDYKIKKIVSSSSFPVRAQPPQFSGGKKRRKEKICYAFKCSLKGTCSCTCLLAICCQTQHVKAIVLFMMGCFSDLKKALI